MPSNSNTARIIALIKGALDQSKYLQLRIGLLTSPDINNPMIKAFVRTPALQENTRNAGLDWLRIAAITLVFIRHYPGAKSDSIAGFFFSWGWTGVDLFFVLSGFLLGSKLFKLAQRNDITFGSFYAQRLLRTVPAYYAMVAIYFSLPQIWEGKSILPLWRFLTFTCNFSMNTTLYGTMTQSWSLCVEEHFYLVLPILIWLIFRLRLQRHVPWMLLGLLPIAWAIRLQVWHTQIEPLRSTYSYSAYLEHMYFPTYTHFDGLIIGVLLAWISTLKHSFWERLLALHRWIFPASILTLALGIWLIQDIDSFSASLFAYSVFGVAYGGLLVTSMRLPKPIFLGSILEKLADLAYCIYLTHIPVMYFAYNLFTEQFTQSPIISLRPYIVILSVLSASYALRAAIEKPFLRLRQHFYSQKNLKQTRLAEGSI